MTLHFLLLTAACLLYLTNAQVTSKPNLVWVLTDDQDLLLGGFTTMPKTKKIFVDGGLTFNNGFVSSPVCCVSRASMLAGRYVHNTGTFNNSLSGGCNSAAWRSDVEPLCYPVYIQAAGYQTFYGGKYLNQYGQSNAGGTEHVPPGWTDWYGLQGNSKYYNYTISNNGVAEFYGDNYDTDYLTDNIGRAALKFLGNFDAANNPFMMVLAVPSAHAPFTPAPQYMNTDVGQMAPRTPNWNVTGTRNANKHQLMRDAKPMNDSIADQSDEVWRDRLRTLISVDDVVQDLYNELESLDVLDNTYWFYMSDHGFHLGQFGMSFDKRQLYETDIRIPFFAAGPGIVAGSTSDLIADNVDMAPTLVELATGTVPESMDGRSLVQYLNVNNAGVPQDQIMYLEYDGDGHGEGNFLCGSGIVGVWHTLCDSWNNSYTCVREILGSQNQVNGQIYCQFHCWDPSHSLIDCQPGTPESQGEFYNLETDPWQLNNTWNLLSSNDVSSYENMIKNYNACSGQTECVTIR